MANRSESEVVVITGATAGVGRATARAFAEQGARIGLLARGQEGLEGAKRDVEARGGEALAVPTDVADADQVEKAAEKVEAEFGPIDVWVNDAMTGVFAEFTDIEPDEYERVTDVCYHGQVYGTRSALRRMRKRDRGSIVLVGSALAYRGIPLQSAYCGAKHATQGMFDSIRAELIHNDSNVQITMVQLPAMNTPQFGWVRSKLPKKAQPVPPIYQPEVAADAVVWATHHDRREVYVGASSAQVIIGNKLFPRLGDWYLGKTGYSGQQTDEPEDEGRPDNLFEPVAGDRGAHGAFDDRARSWSPQLWLDKNKRWLALGGAALAGVMGALWSD
jgi:NADP-dependent 3-hydroxy acid dehydrogenase YdfG